jgi:hypothetical protein
MPTPSDLVYSEILETKTKICNRKTCQHSGAIQPITNFFRNRTELDGIHGTCKDCTKIDSERRKRINKESPSPYIDGKVRICSRKDCIHNGIEQPVTNFYRHTNQTSGLSCECKDCSDASAKKYRNANPEKVKECIKKWAENNQDRIKLFQLNYYKEEKKFRTEHWEEVKIKDAKRRAEKKNIPFDLEVGDLSPLPKFCSVFGVPLDYSAGTNRRLWASVDRIKPELGYVKGNVRVISLAANMAKFDGDGDIISIDDYLRSL